MDKEKLNEASYNHAKIMGDVPEINSIHAFKSGAEWLMQQPIFERLTDAEIAKAIAAYRRAEEGCNGNDGVEYAIGRVVKTVLNEIFGNDLFK